MITAYQQIENLVIRHDVDFSSLTTMKVGGKALLVVEPYLVRQIIQLINILKESKTKYFVLGRGSNCIACGDYDGVIVLLANNFSSIASYGDSVVACAGAPLAQVAQLCLKRQLSGAEFLATLPGSVGGGVTSNCGCFGQEICDIVSSALLTDGYVTRWYSASELKFNYRTSLIKDSDKIALKVKFKLKKGDRNAIEEKITQLKRQKLATQPLNYPSSGSIFLRQGEIIPAKLIELAGLKGIKVGDAQISPIHSGFIVNCGHATSQDVVKLIEIIQNNIFTKYQVKLVKEVVFIK
ncbi:MAG: UDP-N-acetylmuramate dehydrogenase [Clostridia bacterium]